MAEAKVLDEVGALCAFACRSYSISVMSEKYAARNAPAPGPPSTKITVTLLLSKTGFFALEAEAGASACAWCRGMCSASATLSTMDGMLYQYCV